MNYRILKNNYKMTFETEHKGFDIMRLYSCYKGDYFYKIFKDSKEFSVMSFVSKKACKNVIDTYVKRYNK